jgi:hypothetical protein
MTTLTVNITNEKDLSVMEEILSRFGLSYQINTEYDFKESEIKDLLKTKQDFLEGKSSARDWNNIEQDLNRAFN